MSSCLFSLLVSLPLFLSNPIKQASPQILRVYPESGTKVTDTLQDLHLEFDGPMMEHQGGRVSIVQRSSQSARSVTQGPATSHELVSMSMHDKLVFSAGVPSPNVWVGRGDHSTHYGATVTLVVDPGVLQVNYTYCVCIAPDSFRSQTSGLPWGGILERDWCFDVTANGLPIYPSFIPQYTPEWYPTISKMVGELHDTQKEINATVYALSSFYNRFFESQNGLQAHQWLAGQYRAAAAVYPNINVTITSFNHTWIMPSLIVKIEPSQSQTSEEVVVLGAHLDTINRQNWTVNQVAGRAPGANDDGSGIAVQLEIFKTILKAFSEGLTGQGRSIELHAYSGEEEGLYGSADVAFNYRKREIQVAAMLMLDQCGFVRDPEHPVIGVFTDHTDKSVNRLLQQLIGRYSNLPYVMSNENGRADSDFHSFYNNGYRAGYIAEGPVDDIVYGNSKHTAWDLPGSVNLTHVVEIGGVALSFLVEVMLFNASNTNINMY